MHACLYIMYDPRTEDGELPFRVVKESNAALEGAVREQGGVSRELWE